MRYLDVYNQIKSLEPIFTPPVDQLGTAFRNERPVCCRNLARPHFRNLRLSSGAGCEQPASPGNGKRFERQTAAEHANKAHYSGKDVFHDVRSGWPFRLFRAQYPSRQRLTAGGESTGADGFDRRSLRIEFLFLAQRFGRIDP